jgi:hypothetical protein
MDDYTIQKQNNYRKTCTNCLIEKHIDEFHSDGVCEDGKRPLCMICLNQIWKKQKEDWDERMKLLGTPDYRKKCNHCKEFLPPSRFYKDCSSYDGFRSICKPCMKIREKGVIK